MKINMFCFILVLIFLGLPFPGKGHANDKCECVVGREEEGPGPNGCTMRRECMEDNRDEKEKCEADRIKVDPPPKKEGTEADPNVNTQDPDRIQTYETRKGRWSLWFEQRCPDNDFFSVDPFGEPSPVPFGNSAGNNSFEEF